jgi:hypothetical protein
MATVSHVPFLFSRSQGNSWTRARTRLQREAAPLFGLMDSPDILSIVEEDGFRVVRRLEEVGSA